MFAEARQTTWPWLKQSRQDQHEKHVNATQIDLCACLRNSRTIIDSVIVLYPVPVPVPVGQGKKVGAIVQRGLIA